MYDNDMLSDTIIHSWAGSDKAYSAKEKAREKSYNHEYYMKNKEKWGVKKEDYADNDPDFFDSYRTEDNRIGDSDFFAFQDKNGIWTIVEEDMKWKLPKGIAPDNEMRNQLEAFRGFQDPNIKSHEDWDNAVLSIINGSSRKEFDTEAAAKDVISGKYGNGKEREGLLAGDYAAVQKKVNELLRKQKSSNTTKESSKTEKVLSTVNSSNSRDLKKRGYSSSTSAKHSGYEVEYIAHHGILGQRWGIRRFQNEDGSLTSAGKARYGSGNLTNTSSSKSSNSITRNTNERQKLTPEQKEKVKKAAIIGASAIGTALAIYGGYKLVKSGKVNRLTKNGTALLKGSKLSTGDVIKNKVNKAKMDSKIFANINSNDSDIVKSIYEKNKKYKAKQYVFGAGRKAIEGVKEGIPEGSYNAGKTFGKVVSGGLAFMALVTLGDLASNSLYTNKISKAYNDHQKKNGKVSTSFKTQKKKDDDDE